jgi:endo-1,4-beta-xylanase
VPSIRAFAAAAVTTAALSALTLTSGGAAHAASDASGTAAGRPAAGLPLRLLALQHHVRIGTAVDMAALADDATYKREAGEQFSTVTPENVMKWDTLEPQQGTYDYRQADDLVTFAQARGQKVRGHVLVWHNQLPSWVTSGDYTADQLRAILHKHITDTVTHFKGRIWQWDVVNEAFNEDGTLRDSIWLQKLGPGYIADAFRWAHEADPHAKLFYNDYNIEWMGPKSNAVYALVKQLRSQGVPIDGVGFQGHLDIQYSLPGDMPQNMARFDALGLDTAVTEADVRIPMPTDATKLQQQADGYRLMLNSCLATRHCISFTVWGFTDKYSWVPGVFTGEGAANLMDESYAPKPAFRAVQDALAARD